jgi:hypothetical protein
MKPRTQLILGLAVMVAVAVLASMQQSYIAEEKKQFLQRGLPITSVDTKKKELVGNFKNAGRVWSRTAGPV